MASGPEVNPSGVPGPALAPSRRWAVALAKTMRNSGSSASSRMPIGAMLSACHHETCEAGPGGGASAAGAFGGSGASGPGASWPAAPEAGATDCGRRARGAATPAVTSAT